MSRRSVHRIETSSWSPPSPDPAGLTYRGSNGRLLAGDSEVDEIPSLYTGQNLFEATPDGTLLDTGNTEGNGLSTKSLEAADVAWDNNSGAGTQGQVLYVVDDDRDRVLRYNPQADGRIGTADDTSGTALSLNNIVIPGYPNGITDAEGLAYRMDDRSLYLTDGVTATVFHIERGADGKFGGPAPRDDIITSFDAAAVGMRDPEDIEYDPVSGHLFIASRMDDAIAETTTAGALVNLIDISAANIDPSGITFAPGSTAPSERHLYVSDRGRGQRCGSGRERRRHRRVLACPSAREPGAGPDEARQSIQRRGRRHRPAGRRLRRRRRFAEPTRLPACPQASASTRTRA